MFKHLYIYLQINFDSQLSGLGNKEKEHSVLLSCCCAIYD